MYIPTWLIIILFWIMLMITLWISTKPKYDYDIPSLAVRFFGSIILTLIAALIIAIIY